MRRRFDVMMTLSLRRVSTGIDRGELLAYLKSLGMDFHIIVFSEIGSETSCYLASILTEYTYVYELPKDNGYGGVAIFIKQELNVSERDDLTLIKTYKCSKCNFESVWIDVIKSNESFTVGGVSTSGG